MITFITSLTGEELKNFLKETLKEVLSDHLGALKQQPPYILDVQQASDFLKLKVTTLYEKTCRKQIPHFKKGNKLYFHLSELKEWISQGKVKTQKEISCEAKTYTMNNSKAA